jgi:hypothetical protein
MATDVRTGDYFDAATHRYFLGGREVPGVTTILKRAGIIDTTFLNNRDALKRGTAVHMVCQQMDESVNQCGDWLGEDAALLGLVGDSPLHGYWYAYAQFRRDHAPRYSHVEAGLLHGRLRFGGRADRVCVDLAGKGPAILEIKTGTPADWHGVQLAGYQLLFPTGARWVVYLKPNGQYDLRRCDKAADYGRFMQALADYHATT